MSRSDNYTFEEVTDSLIARAFDGVHTILVGKIEAVNDKTVDVQPVTKQVKNGNAIELPPLPQVSVVNLQGGSSFVDYPISQGDYCLLFVCEHDLSRWHEGGDNEAPVENRRFDLSDTFALVGINPFVSARTIPQIITSEGDRIITGNIEHIGDTTHTGNVTQTGDFTLTGTLNITGDLVLNGRSLQGFYDGHTHLGNLGVPTSAPAQTP